MRGERARASHRGSQSYDARRWVAADGDLGRDEGVRGRPEHNQLQLALVQVQGAAAERRDEDEDEILDSLDVDVEYRAAPHGVGPSSEH